MDFTNTGDQRFCAIDPSLDRITEIKVWVTGKTRFQFIYFTSLYSRFSKLSLFFFFSSTIQPFAPPQPELVMTWYNKKPVKSTERTLWV
jgi:hypothetical protein